MEAELISNGFAINCKSFDLHNEDQVAVVGVVVDILKAANEQTTQYALWKLNSIRLTGYAISKEDALLAIKGKAAPARPVGIEILQGGNRRFTRKRRFRP